MSPILLTGPTASGKSAVAVELAERIGGEIISVDSMQVYRGLDLGTAKPTAEGVGLATTRTVVISSVLTLLLDYMLTAAFLGR